MEYPNIAPVLEAGDLVEASFNRDNDDPIVATQFEISSIDGTRVFGGPLFLGDIDISAGWTVEVTRKGDPKLPANLSYIAAAFTSARLQPVKLIGRGSEWQRDGGGYVDAREVLAWMPWHEWEPRIKAYADWKDAEMVAAGEAAAAAATAGLPQEGQPERIEP